MYLQAMNRVMGEMKLVVIAVAPGANFPVKVERDPLAPRQGPVQGFGHQARDASACRRHSPKK